MAWCAFFITIFIDGDYGYIQSLFSVFSLVSLEKMDCKVVFLICLIVVQLSNAMPFIFRFGNGQYDSSGRGREGRGGRSYNDIARVINPNPYANIGGVPFPAQPFWTFG